MEDNNTPNNEPRYCLKGQSNILKQNAILSQINEIDMAFKLYPNDPYLKDLEEYYLINSNFKVPEDLLRRSPRLLIRHYGLEEYFCEEEKEEDPEATMWLNLRKPNKNPDIADTENFYIDNPNLEPPKWLLYNSDKVYSFVELSKKYDVKLLQDFIRYNSSQKSKSPVNPHKEERLGKLKNTTSSISPTFVPKPVPEPQQPKKKRSVITPGKIKAAIYAAIALFAVIVLMVGNMANSYNASQDEKYDKSLVAQSMPVTGYEFHSSATFKNNANCPFTIETADYDTDAYYIKILDAYTEKLVYSTFIRPGETLELNVPDGDYIVRYACGEEWYGEYDLFGSKTYCSEIDDTFDFYTDSDGYNGYTLELYKQTDGNLSETYLDVEDF